MVIKKASKTKASFWGLARPAKAATKIVLQQRSGSSGAWSTLKTITTNSTGYWTATGTLGSSTRQWRVKWTDAQGKTWTGAATRAMA